MRAEPFRRRQAQIVRACAAAQGEEVRMANGNVVEITGATFKQAVEKDGIVLLDWWASWCGPCRAFAPVYEKVAEGHPDVTFGKIDTEANQDLAAAFEIRSIPTLMILRDRVLLYSQPGALPHAALEDLIRQVRALDMEKVRKEIAQQEQQPGSA
jgi:thioredoxin 1